MPNSGRIGAKANVVFKIDPKFAISLGWVAAQWEKSGFGPFVITSLNDSHASNPASAHHKGLAADIRTRDFFKDGAHDPRIMEFAKMLQNEGFAVVIHPDWVPGDPHLHVAAKKVFVEQPVP